MVDYCIMPHDQLHKCINFTVTPTSKILENYDLFGLISERCRPPDHSLLRVTFVLE